MRNYVIINGVNSLTIQGLAINNLPPITKPMIRTQREEIDGRDGDIVTELGYAAYDKQMEIGLYGNYDINDIIKYFTGEGTITFSNEEDKYYHFKILDQIDYEKLLKFKTAVVTLHCQPFKYPIEETPLTCTITTLNESGTSITLNNTVEAPMKIEYKGNTLQSGTPTPDNPVDIQVVSGDNTIEVVGKNLFDISKVITSNSGGVRNNNDGTLTITTTSGSSSMQAGTPNKLKYYCPNLKVGDTVTFSMTTTGTDKYIYLYGTGANVLWSNNTSKTITQAMLDASPLWYASGVSTTATISNIQIEKGNQATPYEEYKGASYPISLGDIELCKIGTYQDYIRKSTGKNLLPISDITNITGLVNNGTSITLNGTPASTSWTLSKPITLKANTTYILSLSNTISDQSSTDRFMLRNGNTNIFTIYFKEGYSTATYTPTQDTIIDTLRIYTTGSYTFSNYTFSIMLNEGTTATTYEPYGKVWYKYGANGKVVLDENSDVRQYTGDTGRFYLFGVYGLKGSVSSPNAMSNYFNSAFSTNNGSIFISGVDGTINMINTAYHNNVAGFKTWLGTAKPIVYYILNTPTYTEITDSTLINQLEAVKRSVEGQTNISQTNDDLPFELDVSVTFIPNTYINNIGNFYARPTIELEGTGEIDAYLDDVQVLKVDMGDSEKIIIDSTHMEAYDPDTNTLANRQVDGDYSKLKIEAGNTSKLMFAGNLTNATITDYTRWL